MNDFLKKYAELLHDDSGVKAIDLEMARQNEDVVQTMADQKEAISAMADAIKPARVFYCWDGSLPTGQ